MSNCIHLEIQQKTFPKSNFSILKNFTLTVQSGEKLAIVGPSGVGKTSLLNILGLLDTHYEGTYTLFDSSTADLTTKQLATWRNQKIGFVLQESALIPSLTIEDNIKLPLLYANLEKDPTTLAYVKEVVHRIGIASILKKKPHECSGGQRSRAVFARAVIMKPDIILADEPTASLDTENKEKIMNLLFDLNLTVQTIIITVTHDLDVANRHDRMITLQELN